MAPLSDRQIRTRLARLAHCMAEATDAGDRATARRLLRRAERIAAVPARVPAAGDEAVPMPVLARAFAALHRRALRKARRRPSAQTTTGPRWTRDRPGEIVA